MFKKPIFLFIATFIIALALGSYFVVQEVRGKVVTFNNPIDMGSGAVRITNLGNPTVAGDAINKGYADTPEKLCFAADAGYCAFTWCDVNDFSWCVPVQDIFKPDGDYGGGCFTAETPILMADGKYKSIKDVREGDWVLTKENESSDKMVSAKVTKTFEHTAKSYLIINNELKVTDIHPIFVNKKWKQAKAIELGNKLLNEKGQEAVVESLEIKRETIKVYNLEIEGYETYFAGGVYVHNKAPENGEE